MAKLILRILYFALSVIIAVFVGMLYYQSEVYQEIYDKTQEWLKAGDYTSIGRMYSGYFNKVPLVDQTDGKAARIVVFESTQEDSFSYYKLNDGATPGSTKDSDYTSLVHHTYDSSYSFIFYIPSADKVKYNLANIDYNDKVVNNFGLRFYDKNDNTKYYDYKFEISNTVNKEEFVLRPLSEKEYILHGKRDLLTNFYSSWGFCRTYINVQTLNTIEEASGIDIGSFNVCDNSGKNMFASNISLDMDFKEQFFTDIKPLLDAYSEYLPIYNDYNYANKSKVTKDEYNAATDAVKEKLDKWTEEAKAYPNYLTAFEKDELTTSAPIWKTVGVLAIYALAIFILYIILFEFKRVKNFVFKDRKNHQRYVPNKMPDELNKTKDNKQDKANKQDKK